MPPLQPSQNGFPLYWRHKETRSEIRSEFQRGSGWRTVKRHGMLVGWMEWGGYLGGMTLRRWHATLRSPTSLRALCTVSTDGQKREKLNTGEAAG
jgi:hypothetical protein